MHERIKIIDDEVIEILEGMLKNVERMMSLSLVKTSIFGDKTTEFSKMSKDQQIGLIKLAVQSTAISELADRIKPLLSVLKETSENVARLLTKDGSTLESYMKKLSLRMKSELMHKLDEAFPEVHTCTKCGSCGKRFAKDGTEL